MTDKLETRMPRQVLDIAFGPREEIVHTNNVMPIGQKAIGKMRAEETCASSNENGFAIMHKANAPAS